MKWDEQLDELIDELVAVIDDVLAAVRELEASADEALEKWLQHVAHQLYRWGYRLQGIDSPEDGQGFEAY